MTNFSGMTKLVFRSLQKLLKDYITKFFLRRMQNVEKTQAKTLFFWHLKNHAFRKRFSEPQTDSTKEVTS